MGSQMRTSDHLMLLMLRQCALANGRTRVAQYLAPPADVMHWPRDSRALGNGLMTLVSGADN